MLNSTDLLVHVLDGIFLGAGLAENDHYNHAGREDDQRGDDRDEELV